MDSAVKLEINLIICTDQALAINAFGNDNLLFVNFNDPEQTAAVIVDYGRVKNIAAVVGVDEATTLAAAFASESLGLNTNPSNSVINCHNKFLFRQVLKQSNLLCPNFHRIELTNHSEPQPSIPFPSVLKPLGLSASRGVIRVDGEAQFRDAVQRIKKLLQQCPELPVALTQSLICETYIPGAEFALEGILSTGKLTVLAIFDKPDVLNGPFFEETIYITPSRLPGDQQQLITNTVELACEALELHNGPIHAEVRINEKGCWMIELATRSIGGHCSRALNFVNDDSLETLILSHALGQTIRPEPKSDQASGVMMIPIPKKGKLCGITGISSAQSLPCITGISIDIPIGDNVIPLPEGDRYLGFIFARANDPEYVESSLRAAFSRLIIDIV